MNATTLVRRANPVPEHSSAPVRYGSLQRKKCACGGTPGPSGECAECRTKRLSRQHRWSTNNADPSTAPPIVNEVLRSSGQPLDRATRAFMEPRFGHDFGRVRVHTDTKAAESAQAVHASAYTVGHAVVFGAGRYAPGTGEGRKLVAHELAHVVQQRGESPTVASLSLDTQDDPAERAAEVAAAEVVAGNDQRLAMARISPLVQRKIQVEKPADNIPNPTGKGAVQTNAATIQDYLTTICAAGSVTVDPKTGDVGIGTDFCTRPQVKVFGISLPFTTQSPAQASTTPAGCGCICDLVTSAHLWKIRVDDGSWPHTVFDDDAAALGKKPGGTGGTVTAPSPNSPKLWGAGAASGKELDIDPWLVLGHELCGHGWLGNFGKHGPDEASPRGEGGHQETVARENELRREHGIELRATFKEPNCGESYWRDKAAPGTVNWSKYRAVCQSWRDAFNKAHGTKHKITDTIP
jgi:hypothetical protein